MQAQEIVNALEKPTRNRQRIFQKIIAREDTRQVIAALELRPASRLTRTLLCDILGHKHAKEAVPALIAALTDSDDGVRSSAADALAKVKDPAGGRPLFEQYQREPMDSPARSMILAALGAVQYRLAIPSLIAALEDPDEAVRLCAAWSLGALRADEAEEALEHALAKEPPEATAAANNMREALRLLSLPGPATPSQ